MNKKIEILKSKLLWFRKEYKDLNEAFYLKFPPKVILENLKRAFDFSTSTMYKDLYDELISNFKNEILSFINEAGQDISSSEECLDFLTRISQYFPIEVNSTYGIEFEALKQANKRYREENEVVYKEASRDFRKTVNDFRRYIEANDWGKAMSIYRAFQDHVKKNSRDIDFEIKNNLSKILTHLPMLWDDWKYYADVVDSINDTRKQEEMKELQKIEMERERV